MKQGNNEEGKSTILEAINLCLTGVFRGKYLKNSLTQDIFNNEIVTEYIKNVNINNSEKLPEILIELFLEEVDPILLGMNNTENTNVETIALKIAFNNKFQDEYEILKKDKIITLPIEYYDVEHSSSAGNITIRSVPLKSVLIDTSESGYKNVSDTCVSRIIKERLDEKEIIDISQAYRKARDIFTENETITSINTKLSKDKHFKDNKVEIDVEMLNRNDWEKAIITKINSIPFEFIGKGEQSSFKIELALTNKKIENAGVILIEEPENHLTHSRLSVMISETIEKNSNKQLFITTHSSFVANKLGLEKLLLLNNNLVTPFNKLSDS
jgi:putative ATP-dependent endonuclease of OLD family